MINPLIMVFLLIIGCGNAHLTGAAVSTETVLPPTKEEKSPEILKKEARKAEQEAKKLSEKNKKEAKRLEKALQKEAEEQLKKIAQEAKLKANLIKIETKRKIAEEKKKTDEEALLAKQKAEQDALALANESELKALDEQHDAMLKDLSLIAPTPAADLSEPAQSTDKAPASKPLSPESPDEDEDDAPAISFAPGDWKGILLEKYKENSNLMRAIILEGETKAEEKSYFAREFAAQKKWFTDMLVAAPADNAPEVEILRQKTQKFETVILSQRVADELIQKASSHCSFSESSRKQLRLMILYDLNASINSGTDAPGDLTISQIKNITLKAIDTLSAALAELSMTKEDKERRSLAQELDALRGEITNLKEEHFAIKNKLLEKTQENVALSLDVDQSAKMNADLENQRLADNAKAAEEIAQARAALEELQKELLDAQEHQKELLAKAEQEKRELAVKADLEKQLSEEKVKKTEESIAAYKKRESDLTSQMTALSSDIVELEVSHKKTEGELASSQESVAEKEAQLKKLANKLALLEKATIAQNKELINKDIVPEAPRPPKPQVPPTPTLPIATSPAVSETPAPASPIASIAQPEAPSQSPVQDPMSGIVPSIAPAATADAQSATEGAPVATADEKQKHIPTPQEENNAEALLKNMLDSLETK